ncbi:LysR family transcriptional regulator [Vibrio sp. 99-70-13A1]|uniref:LysR family transcriptional regulator n=1 Tax=Vibrio sp. 99-70-13A1 TaxID=2607601 RepID=UPI001493B515|nr:LysR family transcriptional regulator [Vibrio sp. 99-70-13A1]NOH95192.1 LysR family transcriptional regulator [Vibrio sp. 99-70-13A1]
MSGNLPSTKTLQAFLSTARHLNFTHAANELNLTQGAVSRQILSLEESVGCELFYRHARGLSLTPKGELLVPLIQDTIQQLQSALSQIATSPSKIRLNAPSCITSWLLPKLLSFQQHYPDIDVELTSTIKHVFEPTFDPFDAVITYGKKPKQNSIISQLLFNEQLTPVCNPQVIDPSHKATKSNYFIKPFKLSEYTWLHANSEQSDWKLWLEFIGSKELAGKKNQQFATLDQSMNAAIQGFGIAIGDITLADQDVQLGRLARVSQDTVFSGNGYFFLQPKSRQNTSLTTLIEWLLKSDIE